MSDIIFINGFTIQNVNKESVHMLITNRVKKKSL
jgi:hypothetical protein